MDAGERNELISFERGTATLDEHGGETLAWAEIATAWTQVRRGKGQERREASQEAGSQSATFVCDWTPTLETVGLKDRVLCRGQAWDITDVALEGSNREIQFTAIRSA